MKRPSFQFYPGDWLRDTALRSCSIAARGLWMDMLCFMHEGNPYGYLKVNHKVIQEVNLVVMVGVNLDEIRRLLNELEEAGVFSRDKEGCIFSRRMVQDEKIRLKRSAAGLLGGNPKIKKNHLLNHQVNHQVNQEVNLVVENLVNRNPTPSSSSSSSSNLNTSSTNVEDGGGALTGTPPPAQVPSSVAIAEEEKVSNSALIGELVDKYRAQPNIAPGNKGDFPFIGRLYNQWGYDEVLLAIQLLGTKTSLQPLTEPLAYLAAILQKPRGSPLPAKSAPLTMEKIDEMLKTRRLRKKNEKDNGGGRQ